MTGQAPRACLQVKHGHSSDPQGVINYIRGRKHGRRKWAVIAVSILIESEDSYMDRVQNIPIWEKYTLTIEEAALYFRVGENKLRKIVSEQPNADFILWNGNRPQIKRKKFEEFIDKINVV